MFDSFTIGLGVLGLLIAYLGISLTVRAWLRLRLEEAQCRARERQFPGTAFDVSAIAPQIQKLRQDYLAGVASPPEHSFYRMRLLAVARRIVTSLSYFRRGKPDPEMGEP